MIAITRDVSSSISDCELTHVPREPIDYARAAQQHEQYREMLRSLGCTVVELPADPLQPDCVFVEDTAVVLEDLAVITRPGAASRRSETGVMAEILARYRPLAFIEPPAILDGGDVLVVGERIFAGVSQRTNLDALDQLQRLSGREVVPVRVHGCLHLKSAISLAGERMLLVNRNWIDVEPFAGYELLDVDPSEPFAANVLRIGDVVVSANAFPLTAARLESRGTVVRRTPADELAKAEGGLTCCSILVPE
jgi:dimethylargininase